MIPIVILGAGGHGKVVADALIASGHAVAGFLDDRIAAGTAVFGTTVLGGTEWLDVNVCEVALGVGSNAIRMRLVARCDQQGRRLVTVIHPRATIARSATIADGTVVMAGVIVNPDASVGRGAILNTGCVVEHDCFIGAFAHVSPNATLGGGCRIGDAAQLGIGATMLPYTSIGARTIVGGGGVVTKDLPEDVVAVGVPAQAVR